MRVTDEKAIEYLNGNPIVKKFIDEVNAKRLKYYTCLLYTSPSPRDGLLSRMPSSA